MLVNVEQTGAIGRRVSVTVPSEKLEQEISKRLSRLQQTVRLPGFRPGHAPARLIESRYGESVVRDAATQLIEDSLREALRKEGLTPAAQPEIETQAVGRGKDMEYVASFDVFPEIPRTELAGVRIERPRCEIGEGDVDRTVETMRRQRTRWEAVQRPAAAGDRLLLDFQGTIDGADFPGASAKHRTVVLGAGALLPELEQGLTGARPGDAPVVEFTYPENYAVEKLRGKRARFEVAVHEVQQAVLPEVDAEFAKSFGIADGDLERFRADVRRNLTRELEDRVRASTKERVLQALLEVNPIEVPAKLVREEASRMAEVLARSLTQQGAAVERSGIEPQHFEAEARRRVALGLILHRISESLKLKPDPEQVRRYVDRIAEAYEDPAAYAGWYYSDPNRLREANVVVLEDQIVEQLLQTANVSERVLSFEELMQGGAAEPAAT
jgi:trigger factor